MYFPILDLSVVIPVHEENHQVIDVIVKELEEYSIEVIVVDDGSKFPYQHSIKHGVNFGYGAALLTGIKNSTRPIVATMDGDGQHTVSELLKLYRAWHLMEADMLIGTRKLKKESWVRYAGRKFLNWSASIFTTYWLPDLNGGMRMFKRDIVMGYFPILCQKFSFTTSLTLSMVCDGYRVEWFPIKVLDRTHGKSRVKVVRDGLITLYYIIRIGFALRTRGIRKIWRTLCPR